MCGFLEDNMLSFHSQQTVHTLNQLHLTMTTSQVFKRQQANISELSNWETTVFPKHTKKKKEKKEQKLENNKTD